MIRRALLCAVLCSSSLLARADERAELDFFEKRIRPVLVSHCYECHSAEADDSQSLKGALRVDTRAALLEGGDSGPAVVPGKPDESLLISAIHYDGFEMPPKGKLPEKVLADFRRWIEKGAVDPRKDDTPAAAKSVKFEIDYEAGREFWAFQQPERHPQPEVERADWPRRPIDGFVLARMEEHDLAPTPEADRRTWLRRLTFDLTGLPPTPEEVTAFLADTSPEAEETVVARLLASPQYGVHWTRMWLDIARYAEDQAHVVGNNKSLFYPNAYLYRDWVIEALNEDLPYDRFVRLQLAADLVESDDETNHAALGFLGLGPKYYGRGSTEVMADEWEDRVDVVSRGLLGITTACARCHDHKFDPIGTADYYALAGVFASTKMLNRPLSKDVEKKGPEAKKPEDALHVVADGKGQDLNVFIRGNVKSKGPVAPRGFPRVLTTEPVLFTEGSGRAELAAAIVDPANPLTARVVVNRVWGRYFGKPLVGTASNFGQMGDRPTHPELLDDLAVRFVENGWSLKWLHREIALSATYRQDSRTDPATVAADPANTWLARMPRRRLPVESWRDALLTAAGRLDATVGGKSIDPQSPDSTRRTLYSRISRLDLNPMLRMFDVPDPNVHSGGRVETTTPLQKLFVLNSPFMAKQVDAFAERIRNHAKDDGERLEFAYALCFSREPTNEERELALAFLASGADTSADAERWRQYAQVLLASNEMLFVD